MASPDVVDIRVFCCLFVECIYTSYMFGWICRATYCSVISTLLVDIRVFCCLFVVCIYIVYVRLVVSSYLLFCCKYTLRYIVAWQTLLCTPIVESERLPEEAAGPGLTSTWLPRNLDKEETQHEGTAKQL